MVKPLTVDKGGEDVVAKFALGVNYTGNYIE